MYPGEGAHVLSSISEILDAAPTAAGSSTGIRKCILVLLDTATAGGGNVQAVDDCSLRTPLLTPTRIPKAGQTHVWDPLLPAGRAQVCWLLEPLLCLLWEAACQHMPQLGASLPLCVCSPATGSLVIEGKTAGQEGEGVSAQK